MLGGRETEFSVPAMSSRASRPPVPKSTVSAALGSAFRNMYLIGPKSKHGEEGDEGGGAGGGGGERKTKKAKTNVGGGSGGAGAGAGAGAGDGTTSIWEGLEEQRKGIEELRRQIVTRERMLAMQRRAYERSVADMDPDKVPHLLGKGSGTWGDKEIPHQLLLAWLRGKDLGRYLAPVHRRATAVVYNEQLVKRILKNRFCHVEERPDCECRACGRITLSLEAARTLGGPECADERRSCWLARLHYAEEAMAARLPVRKLHRGHGSEVGPEERRQILNMYVEPGVEGKVYLVTTSRAEDYSSQRINIRRLHYENKDGSNPHSREIRVDHVDEVFPCYDGSCDGLAVDSRHVYLSRRDDSCVDVFDKDTLVHVARIGRRDQYTGDFNSPSGLCISDNRLFVADEYNHQIRTCTVDPDPSKLGSVSPLALTGSTYPLEAPLAVYVDSSDLYVVDNDVVKKFDKETLAHKENIRGYLRHIRRRGGIISSRREFSVIRNVCTADGLLYVSDSHGVHVLDPNHYYLEVFSDHRVFNDPYLCHERFRGRSSKRMVCVEPGNEGLVYVDLGDEGDQTEVWVYMKPWCVRERE